MFKRLSKSRRHSADDVALSLSNSTAPLDELSTTPVSRTTSQDLETATLLKISRAKYSRRSCGDAAAMQTLLETKQDNEQDVIETDYQTVTAVPAFIVEHDPSKQRGKLSFCIDISSMRCVNLFNISLYFTISAMISF